MVNQSRLDDIVARLKAIVDKSDRIQISQSSNGHIFLITPIVLSGDYESLPSITQKELESIPPEIANDLIEEFKEKLSH